MTNFTPGQIFREFKTRSGQKAVLRTMRMDDVKELQIYINELSKEDTFIAYSGEIISFQEEEKFVKNSLLGMSHGHKISLVCEINGEIASNSSVERNTQAFNRSRHIGILGMSVRKKYRREGIGYECMQELITQSRKLEGLKLIQLDVFAENTPAIDLYIKTGFKIVGKLPKQYIRNNSFSDSIVMQYDLTKV